jgi:mycothiol S-conjugate amidase
VITTYDENGGYPHPDHIMCHKISVAAFAAAANPDAYPDRGPAWQPLKLYYSFTLNRERTLALHQAMIARGLESPYTERLREWPEDPEHAARLTTRVPWPTEEWELVRSLVDTSIPEDDLFAGVAEPAASRVSA